LPQAFGLSRSGDPASCGYCYCWRNTLTWQSISPASDTNSDVRNFIIRFSNIVLIFLGRSKQVVLPFVATSGADGNIVKKLIAGGSSVFFDKALLKRNQWSTGVPIRFYIRKSQEGISYSQFFQHIPVTTETAYQLSALVAAGLLTSSSRLQ
jgi:hypothetical protein